MSVAWSWPLLLPCAYAGLVILDTMHRMGLLRQHPVVTIDTLHLFPETYELVKRVKSNYSPELRLHTFQCQNATSREEFDKVYGNKLWEQDPARYGI